MDILSQERNYLPVDLETRYHSCLRKTRSGWKTKKILSYYHITKASFYRWLSRFDGSKESLVDRSHRPLSSHPRKTSEKIQKLILDLHRRNPTYSFIEIWVRLKHKGIIISASTVLRIIQRKTEFTRYKPAKKEHNKIYYTPNKIHEKWQIDVKFVPAECKSRGLEGRFYQYTILDECTRKRYLYFTNEHSMYETVKALDYAANHFGYYPKELQSDNGYEFSDKVHRKKGGRTARTYDNLLERYLESKKIKHHFIRPRTPQHNGKVERSHRIDQDKFYRYLKFFSLDDLWKQGLAWNKRYNEIPKLILGFKTPNEMELEKLEELRNDTI